MAEKQIIGRSEWVKFIALHDKTLLARVDTGARTSSLHATGIEEFVKEGEPWIRFVSGGKPCEALLWKKKRVRSSNGEPQCRYFIETEISFADGSSYPVQVSLSDRASMRHPVLLGRRLLWKRFLVNVARSFILGRFDTSS